MKKPLILITNDDGIDSKGIRFLVSVMKNFGEVVVGHLIAHNLVWVTQLLFGINLG